jgi:hypothetical protein
LPTFASRREEAVHYRVPGVTVILVATLISGPLGPALHAQAQQPAIDTASSLSLAKRLREQETRNRTFKFGLSVGWRHVVSDTDELYRNAVLTLDSMKVQAERIDRGDVVLSGVVVAFPGKPPAEGEACCRGVPGLWRIGFIANIDLASFANDELKTFNKSIEGGFGVALRLGDDFSLALTLERVLSRKLRSYIENGKQIPGLTDASTFTKDNDTFFANDNLTAFSVKFVYFLR